MASLKTAFGDPTHDGGNVEYHEVTTDGGSTTLEYDKAFDTDPALIVSGESGDAGWSARGTSQATITGTDGDTVFVLVIGQ